MSDHRAHILAALVDITPATHPDHPFEDIFAHAADGGAGIGLDEAAERGRLRVAELGAPDGGDGGMATVTQPWIEERFDLEIGYGAGPLVDEASLTAVASADARLIDRTFRNGATWLGTDVDLMRVGRWRLTWVSGQGGPWLRLTIPLTVNFYD